MRKAPPDASASRYAASRVRRATGEGGLVRQRRVGPHRQHLHAHARLAQRLQVPRGHDVALARDAAHEDVQQQVGVEVDARRQRRSPSSIITPMMSASTSRIPTTKSEIPIAAMISTTKACESASVHDTCRSSLGRLRPTKMWNATSATASAASSSLLHAAERDDHELGERDDARDLQPQAEARLAAGAVPVARPRPTTRTSEGSTSMRFTPREG